jgi:hypothetical protein
LQLLRAHDLIAKIPKTHRYQVTESGWAKITALIAARAANTKKLLQSMVAISRFPTAGVIFLYRTPDADSC